MSTPGTQSLQPLPAVTITADGQTLTTPTTNYAIIITGAADHTGLKLNAGTTDGQLLFIRNDSAHIFTFATGDKIAGGALVIPVGRTALLQWGANSLVWSPILGG